MLDVSLGEFVLIALVAMAFLGPERIPVMARKIGEFVHFIKDAFMQVREEVIKDEETASVFNEMQQTVQDIANAVNVRKAVREIGQPLFSPSNQESNAKNYDFDDEKISSHPETDDFKEENNNISPESNQENSSASLETTGENASVESSFSPDNHGFSLWADNLSREIPFDKAVADNSSESTPESENPQSTATASNLVFRPNME